MKLAMSTIVIVQVLFRQLLKMKCLYDDLIRSL